MLWPTTCMWEYHHYDTCVHKQMAVRHVNSVSPVGTCFSLFSAGIANDWGSAASRCMCTQMYTSLSLQALFAVWSLRVDEGRMVW